MISDFKQAVAHLFKQDWPTIVLVSAGVVVTVAALPVTFPVGLAIAAIFSFLSACAYANAEDQDPLDALDPLP